jgi:HEAT repeat protein
MSKRSIALVILAAIAIGMIGLLFLGDQEPSYHGKSLNYWIDPWAEGGHETAADRSAALAAMSENAVPYLAEKLRWKPSPIMHNLYKKYPKFNFFVNYEQGRWDSRGKAAHALGEFGPLATNAIPDLMAASTNSDLNSSWYPRICAKAALIKIRQESLAPYVEKLKDTSINYQDGGQSIISSIDNWTHNALMIGEFGTNAAAAIPYLISALGPTINNSFQAHALMVLGEIHSHPEICVPAIVPFLTSPDVASQYNAVVALGQFRDGAKPAWADLMQCLDDSNPWTRRAAAVSLKAIDPARAAKESAK